MRNINEYFDVVSIIKAKTPVEKLIGGKVWFCSIGLYKTVKPLISRFILAIFKITTVQSKSVKVITALITD